MFLSAVWTLILTAPIHCRASIAETVMQCYISPNLMKKQTHLHLGWPEDGHTIKCEWLCWSVLVILMKIMSNYCFSERLFVKQLYIERFIKPSALKWAARTDQTDMIRDPAKNTRVCWFLTLRLFRRICRATDNSTSFHTPALTYLIYLIWFIVCCIV